MKKITVICFLLLPGFILISCKNDNPVCPELSIEGVFPFSAAPNEPVLIKGAGFNQDDGITIRFGTQKADILEKNKSYISTKVPPGLLGVVELSVSNAQGCLVTKNFEVTSSNPAPGSPPVYFIPPSGFAFPVQIPTDESIDFVNVYDPSHKIVIWPFRQVMEIEYGDVDTEANIEFWGGKKNPISGNVNLPKNEINLKIDRSVKDDVLIGGFYTITLRDNGEEKKDNFFIAFSSVTGQQYVFYIIR
jgi:hypothetical protein